MLRRVDIIGWILLILAAALGVLMAWLADLQFFDENTATLLGYSTIFFIVLVMAVRRAWGRWRLWVDIAGLLFVHITVVAALMNLFSGHVDLPFRPLLAKGGTKHFCIVPDRFLTNNASAPVDREWWAP